jgi:hypothetical protein
VEDPRFTEIFASAGQAQSIKRGFACGDNASKYARRAHAMGTAHQWTPAEARAWGRKGGNQFAKQRAERLVD